MADPLLGNVTKDQMRQALRDEIQRRLQANTQVPQQGGNPFWASLEEAPPEPGGFVSTNLKKGLATVGEAAGGLGKFLGAEDYGQQLVDYSKAKNEEYEKSNPSMELKDIDGVGSGLKYVAENTIKMAPLALSMAPTAYAGGALGALAGLGRTGVAIAGGLGATAGSIGTEAGIISADIDKGKLEGNRGRVLTYAVPAGILETIPELVGFARTGLGKLGVDALIKKYGAETAQAAVGEAAKGGFLKTSSKVLKDLGLTMASEGMTESAQSPLEAAGAGKQVFKDGKQYSDDYLQNTLGAITGGLVGGDNYTEDMKKDMLESMAGGAAGGLGMGAGGHVTHSALKFISGNTHEVSVTDALTREEVTPQFSPETQNTREWTAQDVVNQTSPEAIQGLQNHLQEVEAQRQFDATPEGQLEVERKAREDWRNSFLDKTGGTNSAINKAYTIINEQLTPAAIENSINKGLFTQEDIDTLQKQRTWMETDPVIASSSTLITKKLEKEQKAQAKIQDEHNRNVQARQEDLNAFGVEMQKLDQELKDAKTAEDKKVTQAKIDATVAEFGTKYNLAGEELAQAAHPTSVHNPETNQYVPTEGTQKQAYGPTTTSGVKQNIVPADYGAKVRAVATFNKEARITHSASDSKEKFVSHDFKSFDFTTDKKTGEITAKLKPTETIITPTTTTNAAPVTQKVVKKATKGKPQTVTTTKNTTEVNAAVDSMFEGLAKKEEVDQRTSKETFSEDDAHKLIKHLLGPTAKVEVIDDTHIKVKTPDGRLVDVPAAFIKDTIVLAGKSSTLYENVNHETIHAAKAMGLFTKQEWHILETRANKWIKEFNIRELYKGLSEAQLKEEAIARAFENRPTDNSLFKRLANFLTKAVNFFRGRGYNSAENIMHEFASGQYASRPIQTASDIYLVLAKIPTEGDISAHISEIKKILGKTTISDSMSNKQLEGAIARLKNMPKAMFFQKVLAGSFNLDVDHSTLFFNKDQNLSFSKLQAIPKEARLEAILKGVHPDTLKGSVIASLFSEIQKIKDKSNPENVRKMIEYKALKDAFNSGNYYDGSDSSFHAVLSNKYASTTTRFVWDIDNALFAFAHTGFSDSVAVPELFLPRSEGVAGSKKSLLGAAYKETLTKNLINGYKYKLGLNVDHRGLMATPIVDLARNSKLLTDIVGLADPKNKGTLLKLKDYNNSVDRNIISMNVINYLARIGAINIYDMSARGENSFADGDIKKHVDSFEKVRSTITDFFANQKTGERNVALDDVWHNALNEIKEGDTYIVANPKFKSLFAALGSAENSSDVFISDMVTGRKQKTEKGYKLDQLIAEQDRRNIYNAIDSSFGDHSVLYNTLTDIALSKFSRDWNVDISKPLDSALLSSLHKYAGDQGEGPKGKQALTLIRSTNKAQAAGLKAVLTQVRVVNDFKMPIEYSTALHIVAQDAYENFEAGQNTVTDKEAGSKEYHAVGEARLYKALAAILAHRAHFDIPIHGEFDKLLTEATDYFLSNGNILDKVTMESVFPKGKTTLSKEEFSAIIPVLTPIINRELGITDAYGLPNTAYSSKEVSKISILENSTSTGDRLSSIKSVEELTDRILENESGDLFENTAEESSGDDSQDTTETKEANKKVVTIAQVPNDMRIGNILARLGSSDVEALRTSKAFSALIKALETNKSATELSQSTELRRLVNTDSEVIKKAQAIKGLDARLSFLNTEYNNKTNELYNELLAIAKQFKTDNKSLTPAENLRAVLRANELADTLGIKYKSSDVALERPVLLDLGKIFERYGNDWSAEQKAAMTTHLPTLVASIIYGASKNLHNENAPLQIFPISRRDVAGNTTNYLQVVAASEATKATTLDKKADQTFTYNKDFDETQYDEAGNYRPTGLFAKELSAKEKQDILKMDAMAWFAKYPARKGAGSIYAEHAEKARLQALHKEMFNTLIAENTKNYAAKEVEKVEKSITQLMESMDVTPSAYDILFKELVQIADSKMLRDYNIDKTSDLKNMQIWSGFIQDISYKVESRLSKYASFEKGKFVYSEDTNSTFKSKQEIKELLKRALDNYIGEIQKHGQILSDVLEERLIDQTEQVTGEIPVGAIYKPVGKNSDVKSIRVLPTAAGFNPKTWVQYESVDVNGARKGDVRTVLKTKFEKDFVRNTNPNAENNHLTYRYDSDTANRINYVKNKFGAHVAPIMGKILDFFANKKGVNTSVEDLLGYITTPDIIGNTFNYEDFKKSGYTSKEEFAPLLKWALDEMASQGLIIFSRTSDKKAAYTTTDKLRNFYTSVSLGSSAKARMDAMTALENTRDKFKDTASAIRTIKQYFTGISETKVASFIRDMVSTPWRDSRVSKAFREMMLKAGARSEKREAFLNLFAGGTAETKAVSTVFEKLKEIRLNSSEQHDALQKLILEGDKAAKVFNTIEAAHAVSPTLTQDSFKAYQELQNIMPIIQDATYNAGAHMYAEWANTRFGKEHEFTDILRNELVVKKLDASDMAIRNGITDKLLLQVTPELRAESLREMRQMVTGYYDWLNKKRTQIAKTPGWMPRIRFAKDFVGSVTDADGKLIAFRYFDKSAQAQEYVNSFEGRGYTTEVGKADADMRGLFTTMDSIRGMENIEDFLGKGLSNDWGQPSFGVSTLADDEAGGKHLIERVSNVVLGYEDTDYINNYLTAFSRMANSFAQLQYGLGQRELLRQARLEAQTNQKVKELLPKFVEHLKYELGPGSKLDYIAGETRNLAVFTFMGFRVLPAIVNSTQPFTVGAPMLAKRLSALNGESYTKNLATSMSLMKKGLSGAILDMRKNVLAKDNSKISTTLAKLLGEAADRSRVDLSTMGLTHAEELALQEYHKYNVATQSVQSSATLMNDYKEEMMAMRMGKQHAVMQRVMNESMVFMRLTEQLNRTASFLAAYRTFSKNSEEFNVGAAKEAAEFVYDSQFMVNSFNMPLSIKQMGPLGKTAMTLSMYPIHLLNAMYDTIGGKNSAATLLTMVGMSMMLGGAAASPFFDVIESMYNNLTNSSLKLDIRKMGKKAGSPEEFTNMLLRGMPTLAGFDISNNLAMATPFVGGFIAKDNPVEAASGAAGAALKRLYEGYKLSQEGKYGQVLTESMAPEAIAGPARAIRQYTEGMKNGKGMQQMYQGKPLTLELNEVIMAAVGIKSARMGETQEKRQAIRELEKSYRDKAGSALKEARETGNLQPIQQFNQLIVKNQLGALLKPLKLEHPKKEPVGRASFENSI